ITHDPLEPIRSDSKSLLHSIRVTNINLRCGRVLGTGLPSSEPKRQLRKHGTNHDHNLSVRHPPTTEPSRHQPILLRDRCPSDWRKLRNHRLSQTVQFHNWSLRRPVQGHGGRHAATSSSNDSVRLRSRVNNDGSAAALPRPVY